MLTNSAQCQMFLIFEIIPTLFCSENSNDIDGHKSKPDNCYYC